MYTDPESSEKDSDHSRLAQSRKQRRLALLAVFCYYGRFHAETANFRERHLCHNRGAGHGRLASNLFSKSPLWPRLVRFQRGSNTRPSRGWAPGSNRFVEFLDQLIRFVRAVCLRSKIDRVLLNNYTEKFVANTSGFSILKFGIEYA